MSKPEHNPYAAPSAEQNALAASSKPHYSKMVWQVQLLAVCMMVQAALEILYGIYLLCLPYIIPSLNAPSGASAQQQQNFTMLMYAFIGIGVAVILIGITRLIGGIQAYRYRSRIFVLVANVVGLLSLITCYCLPTAAAICVYSFILLLNADVIHAFAMRANGSSVAEIRKHFSK